MLPVSPLSLVVLALLQGAPVAEQRRAATVCQDVQRIELSLEPGTQEICVSPGLLTGFVFDAPAFVELQDEVRFTQITRSRTGVGIMPPEDMMPGERIRLMVRYEDGASISLVLIAHPGQATRQVEVYRDKRTRESFLHEVAQERVKNQQLQSELEQLRAECGDPGDLRRLIASRTMGTNGIRTREFTTKFVEDAQGSLYMRSGFSHRSDQRVAVEVWLVNSGTEPWTATSASLVDAKGKEVQGLRLWQEAAILPKKSRMVVVEVDATPNELRGDVTLVLREDGPRSITLTGVTLPQ